MASCMLICGSMCRWQTSEHDLPGTSIFFPSWLHTSEACSKHCSFNGFQLRPRSSVWWNLLASAVDIRGDKVIVKLQRLEFMLFFLFKNNELVLSQRSIWYPSILEDWKLAQPLEVEVGQEWLDHRIVWGELTSSTIFLEFVVQIEINLIKVDDLLYVFFFSPTQVALQICPGPWYEEG